MPLERKPRPAPVLRCRVCEKGMLEPRRVPRFGRPAFIAGRVIVVLAITNGALIFARWSDVASEADRTNATLGIVLSVAVAGLFAALASRRALLVCTRCSAAIPAA